MTTAETTPVAEILPSRPVEQLTRPLARFLRVESASGVVLLACTALALALANTGAADAYHAFWHTPVHLTVGSFKVGGDLGHFVVNDVLMTIFFFVVGLEIKRELVAGELSEVRKAALPVAAALGGMLAPAGIYAALQANAWGEPAFHGWGVPMATDIAFVVGVMALLGNRVPFGLKILLLSLAIADDIGAVVVIAAFYSTGLDWLMLGLAAAGFGVTYGLNRIGVRAVPVYVLVGALIWLAVYKSGVHPTVAGVLLGLLTPSSAWVGDRTLLDVFRKAWAYAPEEGPAKRDAMHTVEFTAREAVSPLERLEHALHPWVGFVIMPLFALANAGVRVEADRLAAPVSIAVALGLVLGKPAGVMLLSFLAVRLGGARLPDGVSWLALLGGGCLAGIGFTMSLFVAELAFGAHPQLLGEAKLGILIGSLASVILGTGLLVWALRPPLNDPPPAH